MCVGAGLIQETAILNDNGPLDWQAVDEILTQAIRAGQEASNRAMKRRVRQRLHKKLGTMLSKEDFDAAMERFKIMEENGIDAVPKPYVQMPQMQPVCTPSFAVLVPVAMQALPFSLMNQFESKRPSPPGVAPSDTTGLEEMENDLSDLESISHDWQRALSEDLPPVERTFIHFDTRVHLHRRRSRSV
mmetsp:Transcript_80997/g.99219  ORF Transcript_80997/g.99219 Transcript_80997/m.99219 type:complete len:188 (-) Transcript_80997:115-678(-)|eukprot:CAMPEP_0114637378 /NCGR_PEP_ID=MMETSP0191-20121206/68_1 /TAXON_ID=126664 /ORGANISM="Sorites sp." /LENGTH=187 /DNA_ID=CAMNT_0001849101 /DNA_START=43 /DNA_END=606 /DNA_ORIENTATION=+